MLLWLLDTHLPFSASHFRKAFCFCFFIVSSDLLVCGFAVRLQGSEIKGPVQCC